MSSQAPGSKDESLVRDLNDKRESEWSFVSGADGKTNEEREDEREVISHARPGGLERVASEQRLPAEGIGAAEGDLRHTFDLYPDRDDDPGAGAGDRDSRDEHRETERQDEIRC